MHLLTGFKMIFLLTRCLFLRAISVDEARRADQRGSVPPISQTLCGFLNSGRKGTILVGVHDSGMMRKFFNTKNWCRSIN